MTKSILVTIFRLLVLGCSPSENSKTDNFELIVSDFERQLQKDIKDDNIEGSISAAIIKGNKIVWSKAFCLWSVLSPNRKCIIIIDDEMEWAMNELKMFI